MKPTQERTMRAKLVVVSVEPFEYEGKKQNETVTFRGVSASKYPEDGSDENNTFALWSPSVDLKITITNPALWGKLVVGQEYYSDFTLDKDVPSPWKTYKSHKVVEAAKIRMFNSEERGSDLLLERGEFAQFESCNERIWDSVLEDWCSQIGNGSAQLGYLVRYADGYLSYSPKADFEEGYSLHTPDPWVEIMNQKKTALILWVDMEDLKAAAEQ